MHYLDDNILAEILKRLPVKSLLRFKSVCRRWRSLISDRSFMKAHLKTTLDENPNPPQRLISDFPHLSVKITRACDGWEDALVGRLRDNEPLSSAEDWRIVGSCRGLLCIQLLGGRRFFLYNPTTGEYRELPEPLYGYSVPCFGLGYDARGDDYKFVIGTADGEGSPLSNFDLYSLRSDSWRSVGGCNVIDYHILNAYGNYSHGRLYWTNSKADGTYTIISFNVATEEFCENPLPMPRFENPADGRLVLTVSDRGWLFAYKQYTWYNSSEVWIMEVCHNCKPRWTKLCNFSTGCIHSYHDEHRPYYFHIYPLIKDGRIVILCVRWGHCTVQVYDPKENSWKTFTLPRAIGCSYPGKVTCVESLVSLQVDN